MSCLTTTSSSSIIRFQKLLATSVVSSPFKSLLVIASKPTSTFRSLFFSTSTPAFRSFSATSPTMGDLTLDSAMDAVQRRLMFEDESVPSLHTFSFILLHILIFININLLLISADAYWSMTMIASLAMIPNTIVSTLFPPLTLRSSLISSPHYYQIIGPPVICYFGSSFASYNKTYASFLRNSGITIIISYLVIDPKLFLIFRPSDGKDRV